MRALYTTLLFGTAACAAATTSGAVTPAQLVSCGARPSGANMDRQRVSVELRYDVDADGSVVGSSVRRVPNLNANLASDAAVSAATAIALSCRYEPALRDGAAVRSTVSQWFTVEASQ